MTTEQAQVIIILLENISRLLVFLIIGKFIKFLFFEKY